MITGSCYCFQLTVEDLPEAPTAASEEINGKLDLPNVPTQAPAAKVAEVSTKQKGICPFLLCPSTPQNERIVKKIG